MNFAQVLCETFHCMYMVDRLISAQTHEVPMNQLNQTIMQIHESNEFFIQLFFLQRKRSMY